VLGDQAAEFDSAPRASILLEAQFRYSSQSDFLTDPSS
jgi:hypothetical protein